MECSKLYNLWTRSVSSSSKYLSESCFLNGDCAWAWSWLNPLNDVCRANMRSVAWGLATAYGLDTASTGGGPVVSGFKAYEEGGTIKIEFRSRNLELTENSKAKHVLGDLAISP